MNSTKYIEELNMRKIIYVCLSCVLLVFCVACNGDNQQMDRLPRKVEESEIEKTVLFEGEQCINYICNYADKLYFTLHYDNGIYEMDVEENESRKIDIDIPDGYEAGVIATDANGNIYTVFRKEDEYLLVKINSDYEIQFQKEFTEYTDGNSVPWAIAADKDEYVYIRMGNVAGDNLFSVFDKKGDFVGTIEGGKDYWIIDAMGRCADGYVYAVLDTRGKTEVERYIVKLVGKNVEFVIQEVGDVSAESYACCVIGSGVNDDFLIYASNLDCAKGYSYGAEPNKDVGIITEEIKSKASGARCLFLDDGRMLLVTRTGELQEEQIVMRPNNTMYYIPMK